MQEPTTDEIATVLRDHILNTFESDEFGEDEFRETGRFDYVIDHSEGMPFTLMERIASDDTGRRFAAEVDVRVTRLPDEEPDPEAVDWLGPQPEADAVPECCADGPKPVEERARAAYEMARNDTLDHGEAFIEALNWLAQEGYNSEHLGRAVRELLIIDDDE